MINRRDSNRKTLLGGSIGTSVGRATIVGERYAHSCRADGILRRSERQRPVGTDGRLNGEQVLIVRGQLERERLARFVGWAGADVGGPIENGPSARVFSDCTIGCHLKRGCMV